MQWEFRKAIETFEGYKRTVTFKNEIENGDENTLDTVVREIEMILGDKNQKIVPKVLAIRFIRDIMVLGQEDIVKRVQKLIPQLIKICSHDLENSDPDRGQTFFHDHPAYIKARSEEEKKQIDTYGSTFLILTLQSVYHWAKWIPIDSNGQESIYSKAYQTLVDRKVTFPTSFHYYKQSDTQKFKNTYKMEFFTDSYQSAYSETSSVQESQISEADEKQSRSGWEKKSKAQQSKPFQGSVAGSQQYTGQTHHLKTVNEIMQYLSQLRDSKNRKMGALRQINKKIQDMYVIQGGMSRLPKDEKKWLQNYIINFSLLTSNMIDYNQFLQRSLSEEIVIQEGIQEEDITIHKDHRASPMKPQLQATKSIKELSRVNKMELEREGSEIVKKQQYEYKTKLNTLVVQLEEKDNQIAIIRSNYQKEKQKLIEDYECRIGIIQTEVKKGQQDKGAFQRELQKENERLRIKVASLEEELANSNYNTDREKDLESERNHLLTRVKRLEIENEKLQQIKSVSRNYDKDIGLLESTIKEKEATIEALKGEIKKSEKINSNYQDEANLYKTELISERAKHQQKINTVAKSKQLLENENKSLKEKTLEYRKTLDVKEIELINLKEELRRYQSKIKDLNDKRSFVGLDNQKSQQWAKSRTAMQYQSPTRMQGTTSPEKQINSAQMFTSDKKLKFSNYQDLYQELRPNNKQLFIRLCRCGLKRKDILLKENQLQVGIITDVISENKLKFLLHFTNTSEKQVENLKIQYNIANSYPSTLDYNIDNKYIFCIQPQEQEKVSVTVTNKEAPYIKERAILEISFQKNGVLYESNIFLPFFIPKFCDFYKPKGIKLQERVKYPKEISQFRYNKKMLPKPNSLKSFFQSIQEITPNKYELEVLHRQTDLVVKLGFTLTPDSEGMQLEGQVVREKMNEKQKFVFQELFSFLEVAFRR